MFSNFRGRSTLDVTSQPVANENNDQIGLEVMATENRELVDGDKVSNAFEFVGQEEIRDEVVQQTEGLDLEDTTFVGKHRRVNSSDVSSSEL